MNISLLKKIIIYSTIILLIFFLDRATKIYIIHFASKNLDPSIFINTYLSFNLVWNKGIAFGLFSFEKSIIYNFITALIVLINLIILYLITIYKDVRIFFFLMILGGSLGNLFDRLYYNSVPDFIDINYQGYHWFIFNVSDIFITLGVICLIVAELIMNKKNNE
tara:strand:- start:1189 stop:1680 length:492 start_codon:yes stop_codon:yes gene_type:complete